MNKWQVIVTFTDGRKIEHGHGTLEAAASSIPGMKYPSEEITAYRIVPNGKQSARRTYKRLTARQVEAAKGPNSLADGNGLWLRISATGNKQWTQQVQVRGGRRRYLGLGTYPEISLQDARNKARKNRKRARKGIDPKIAKTRKTDVVTFSEAVKLDYEVRAKNWKGGADSTHAKQWLSTLETYAYPILGDLRINQITREDVLNVLLQDVRDKNGQSIGKLWTEKSETARRVRQRLRAVFAWAVAKDYCKENPAGEVIDGALPKQTKKKTRFRSLPHDQVADALATVRASLACDTVKQCFQFTILTAARSGEARFATWKEIDFASGTWNIPGERMKAGERHRVPLNSQAIALLESVKTRNRVGYIFRSPRKPNQALSNMAMTKLLRDAELANRTTVHGFRRSFRTWCADTDQTRELAEAALAHTVQGVEGRYQTAEMLDRRRELMERWGAYVLPDQA